MDKGKEPVIPGQETYNCPLLDRKTCLGECYDIQMVRGLGVRKEVLRYELDFEKADGLCSDCPFNQLPGVINGQWREKYK